MSLLKEACKGFLLSTVCLNDEILKNGLTDGYLYDTTIRQYFKGAYDFIAITMVMMFSLRKEIPNTACIQKIRISHRTNFEDKEEYYMLDLFPVCAIF